jgi:hypothetical protein
MAREVELRVKVTNRQEIDKTTESMNRLKKASDDLNKPSASSSGKLTQEEKLANFIASWSKDLPKAASGAKEAETAISGVTEASVGAGEAIGGMGVSMGAIVGTAALLVIAIAAVIAVAVGLSDKIFNLSKAFAENALTIGKVSEETGLATQTISALKYEAEATGHSFESIQGAVNNFRKTVGQAAAGSEDARAKLNLLGIDGKKAINDIDGSFKSAIATIVKLPPGLEQVRAAYAAFGDEGYKILPFLQAFHGDVDAAIKKAQELGIVLSDKDVKAAREFNRAYVDVQKQIQSLTNTFGREFLDTVTSVLRDVGSWVGRNKTTIGDWATFAGNVVRGVVKAFRRARQLHR